MFWSVSPIRPDGYSERLLLAALLRRAAYDIALYRESPRLDKRRLWIDAYRWMFDDSEKHFASFISICLMLDQDPAKIRRLTLKLRREDAKKLELVDHVRL